MAGSRTAATEQGVERATASQLDRLLTLTQQNAKAAADQQETYAKTVTALASDLRQLMETMTMTLQTMTDYLESQDTITTRQVTVTAALQKITVALQQLNAGRSRQ